MSRRFPKRCSKSNSSAPRRAPIPARIARGASASSNRGRRHTVSRRNRRNAAATPGQAPARLAGPGVRAGRLGQGHEGRLCVSSPRPTSTCTSASARGRSGADLYYPAQRAPIELPPLRECAGDLPEICTKLLDDIIHSGDYLNARMTPSGLAALARYSWPGNVRELRNILERALILSDSGRLTGDDFARILPVGAGTRIAAHRPTCRARVIPYAEAEAAFEKQTLKSAAFRGQRANFGSRKDAADLPRHVLQEARKVRAGRPRTRRPSTMFETRYVSSLG